MSNVCAIQCDNCFRLSALDVSQDLAERKAKSDGWHISQRIPVRDLCPGCLP